VYAANYYEGIYIVAEVIRRARAEGGNYFTGERLAPSRGSVARTPPRRTS